jgi:hypothetical protein
LRALSAERRTAVQGDTNALLRSTKAVAVLRTRKSELYGRALVVIAAEQHACRLVVPSSQQFGPKRWASHKRFR